MSLKLNQFFQNKKHHFLQVHTMKKIEEFGKANSLKPNVSFFQLESYFQIYFSPAP